MTQEFLSKMLGVQRTTVTEAARTLAAAGAISYSRGKVLIKNRAALEHAACECCLAPEGGQGRSQP
jgi:DNA-binding FadR family transcriptional regulator